MRFFYRLAILACAAALLSACVTDGPAVQERTVSGENLSGLDKEDLARLEEIKKERSQEVADSSLESVIEKTQTFNVNDYVAQFPEANDPSVQDYRIGGYDVLDIKVYEEPDLSREMVRVSADGHISFPFIGRVKVDTLSTSQVEKLISDKLAEGQYLLDPHLSVTVVDYKSKNYMVLGSVKEPGSYPLQARERVLDAISRAGGIDFEEGGKQGTIIRTLNPNSNHEKKIAIRVDISELLKGGNQVANLLLQDKDLLHIPKADFFYVIGQVKEPGKFPYQQNKITIVEAISTAGGFTPIAARNRTRIIRMEDGKEKVIDVKVDAITKSGQKLHDVQIMPGDVIVVPESFF
jgi:polysaccharide export outer membrane protein